MSRPTTIVSLFLTILILRQTCEGDAAASGSKEGTCGGGAAQTNRSLGASLLMRSSERLRLPLQQQPAEEVALPQLANCERPRSFSLNRRAPALADHLEGSAYQVVRIGDAEALGKKFARPAPHNDLIFTTWQGSNVFTRFWLAHLEAVGLKHEVLMLTFAPEDCKGMPEQNCVVHELGDILRLMGEKEIPRDDGGEIKGGALAVVSKWIWALAFAKSGYNVLFADSDVAFIRNPLDYWWRSEVQGHDVMGLSDWRVDDEPLVYCNDMLRPHHLNCQSTGIMFFRSNPRVVAVLEKMVREASPPGRKWEQAVWQRFIPQLVNDHKGSYTLLPVTSFMNVEYVQPSNPEAVAIHMGYVGGGCNKMRQFWCLGLEVQGMEADVDAMCKEQQA